jgi:hypothetical protein
MGGNVGNNPSHLVTTRPPGYEPDVCTSDGLLRVFGCFKFPLFHHSVKFELLGEVSVKVSVAQRAARFVEGTVASREPYSYRKTMAGSVRKARRAGSHAATAPTVVNMAAAPTSVSGSRGSAFFGGLALLLAGLGLYGVTMPGAANERLQDQEVEGALEEFRGVGCSHRPSMGGWRSSSSDVKQIGMLVGAAGLQCLLLVAAKNSLPDKSVTVRQVISMGYASLEDREFPVKRRSLCSRRSLPR